MADRSTNMNAGVRWQPPTPPAALAGNPVDVDGWIRWLRSLGYTEAEAQQRLEGTAADPGLRAWVAERLQGMNLDTELSTPTATAAGLAVAYLEARPPASALDLDPRPLAFLSPEDLGARLVRVRRTDLHTGAPVYRDALDGALWAVQAWPEPVASEAVTAAALYRLVGVLAPHARLVRLGDGELQAAMPITREWRELGNLQPWDEHLDALGRELAADAWLGWTDAALIAAREFPTEDLGAVARIRLDVAMGWRTSGARTRGWPEAPTTTLRAAGAYRRATRATMLPMIDRIAGLEDATLRRAVQLGAPDTAEAGRRLAALVQRREAVLAAFER